MGYGNLFAKYSNLFAKCSDFKSKTEKSYHQEKNMNQIGILRYYIRFAALWYYTRINIQ